MYRSMNTLSISDWEVEVVGAHSITGWKDFTTVLLVNIEAERSTTDTRLFLMMNMSKSSSTIWVCLSW